MKPHLPRIIFWVLVVMSVALVTAKYSPQPVTFLPDGQCVLFWHPQRKEGDSLKIEEYLDTVLENNRRYKVVKLEYDVPANQKTATELNVKEPTLVLAEIRSGQIVRRQDLTTLVQKHLTEKAEFTEILRKELHQFAEN